MKHMEILQHMLRIIVKSNIRYSASVEQITGLFLVDVMPEDAAKQIRDFHQKNGI